MIQSLEKGEISAFPIIKRRRPASRVMKVEVCDVYCNCRLPDDGRKMVCCDNCQEWFHVDCVSTPDLTSNNNWFCGECKQDEIVFNCVV